MDKYYFSIIVPYEDSDEALAAVTELSILEDVQKRRVVEERFGLDASVCEIAGILVGSAALLGQMRKLIVEMNKIKATIKDDSKEITVEGPWTIVQEFLAAMKKKLTHPDDEVK